jgi:hypothetical protein
MALDCVWPAGRRPRSFSATKAAMPERLTAHPRTTGIGHMQPRIMAAVRTRRTTIAGLRPEALAGRAIRQSRDSRRDPEPPAQSGRPGPSDRREAVGKSDARSPMWEMEALHRWFSMVPSHPKGEIGPIRRNAAHYL